MRQTIAKTLRKAVVPGDYGIEVEMEFGQPLPPAVLEMAALDTRWVRHADGSLKVNGIEFVTDGPAKIGQAINGALDFLYDKIIIPNHPIESNRTSVHVHKNMLRKTPLEAWTTLFVYWAIEPILIRHCGEDRVGNSFCLQMEYAENLVDSLTRWTKEIENGAVLPGKTGKYSALNTDTLFRIGTFEFRSMYGALNSKPVKDWILLIDTFSENCIKQWETPAQAMFALTDNRKAFLEKVIPNNEVGEELLRKVPDIDEALITNLPELSHLAGSTNWALLNKTKEKEKKAEFHPIPQDFNFAELNIIDGAIHPENAVFDEGP